MTATEITIGIISPSEETRETLRIQVGATGLATVKIELEQYCLTIGDRASRQLLEASPDIIIVDMDSTQSALQTLHFLHKAVPDTWLFVLSTSNDPQLIIETMRTGVREFFAKPLHPRNLSQAIGRYISEQQRRTKEAGKIYCVTSAKGGVGATALSINIATSLAVNPDAHVALIDLSGPIGDAATNLNLKPQFTITDVLQSASRLDPVLLESFTSRANGVSVLAGPREFNPNILYSVDAIGKVLDVATQTYTQTIIDLSSSLNKDYLQIITGMASKVVVVLTPELPAIMRTERLLRFLSSIGATDKLRVVLNRQRKSDEISESEIEKALKRSVNWKLPNNYKGAIQAINTGEPVVTANHSDLASSYRTLAYQLAELPLPEKKTGFLKFFS
ncbi:MAG: AAA family ATPase [Acidobacteriota bacterium]